MTPEVKLSWTPEMARAELASLRTGSTTPPVNNFQAARTDVLFAAAQQHMLNARKALAVGDVDAASKSIALAEQTGADFSNAGDSPQVLQAMINRQNGLVELYSRGTAGTNYDADAARFLLEQAQSLAQYQDYETSTMLAEQAKKFTTVDFSSMSTTPDQILASIAAAQNRAAAVTAATAVAPAPTPMSPKQQVSSLMAQAQLALDQNQIAHASDLVTRAKAYNLGDESFADGETRPWQLELLVENAKQLGDSSSVQPASWNEAPAVPAAVAQATYDPQTDITKNIQIALRDNVTIFEAANPQVPPTPPEARVAQAQTVQSAVETSRGQQLYSSGLQAAGQGDALRAREFFQLAMQHQDDLTPAVQAEIQSQLGRMPAKTTSAPIQEVGQASSEEEYGYALKNQSEYSKLQAEVLREKQAAERLVANNPREALQKMTMLRSRVANTQMAAETTRPLLKIIDRDIDKMQRFIETNLSSIQNNEEIQAVRDEVELDRQRRLDVDQQLAKLVDEYNKYVAEERYSEADLVVRQAEELSPNNEVVVVLREKHDRTYSRMRWETIRRNRERDYVNAEQYLLERTSIMDERTPMTLDPDSEGYAERIASRRRRLEGSQYTSEADRLIWDKLRNTNVEGEYRGTLAEARDQLSRQAGLNIVFDTAAMEDAGVDSNMIIDVPIRQPISLESALNVILSGAKLTFRVEDEVIKITSRESSDAKQETVVHYIGDLLAPMKNYRNPNDLSFTQPGANNGFPSGAFNVASSNPGAASAATLAANSSQIAMAQQLGIGRPGAGGVGGYDAPQRGTPLFGTVGRQGPQGGITQADFDVLIQLIQDTVSPDTWQDTGSGEGTVQAFPPNLSLIVTQSQRVQDEIRELLKKLRELNDVQIVIEVRFVAIQDNFFERIGVDFDFAINDDSQLTDPTSDRQVRSVVVGNTGDGNSQTNGAPFLPTINQDLIFSQGSFASTVPTFGGFDLTSAANFGFAILSDIEVFFLIQASKGSTRATVTEAPTVTMFNGQSASVNDNSFTPFVTSVTPVVGDFAVAHQPIITILPDGSKLDVTATVSADRRSVQMSLVPFFSEITDVETFTFSGSTTTQISTNSLLDDLLDTIDPTNADDGNDELETITEGVTIQLPVLATTSVNTVVSVPDGGTVLLGGIKRSRETRTERGVPMLSSIPYVNRLFTNVGLSRETTNLMLMVTPRIIIQEEEERKQIGVFGDDN